MKRLTCLVMLLTVACGRRMTPGEIGLLKASVGAAAGELAAAAAIDRVQAISTDLEATDPTTHRLGEMECTLLQTRAKALGRDAAAELPLVVRETDRVERLSGELQGAVHCLPSAPFDPPKLAKLLQGDATAIEALLQPER
jgi:hypothetical protein